MKLITLFIVAAFLVVVAKGQFDLGDSKTFSMKVESNVLVVKGEYKGCEGVIQNCLFGCTRTFGEKITVELDCLKAVIEGNTKLKGSHGKEVWFDFGKIRPTNFVEAKDYMNEKKKIKGCTYKKCPVGAKVQVQTPNSDSEAKLSPYTGCTAKVTKIVAPEGGNVVSNFLKKALFDGDCEFEVDTSSKTYLGKQCKAFKTLASCNTLLKVPEGKKRANFATSCSGGLETCPVGKRVQLGQYLSSVDKVDGKFWRNCYGTIAKGTKVFIGSGFKYKLKLDCTDAMVKEKNTCCWPGNHKDEPHLTSWVTDTLFHLK